MALIVETYKECGVGEWAQFGEWYNRYALDAAKIYDKPSLYDVAKSLATIEGHFTWNQVHYPYAISYSTNRYGEPLGDVEFHDFTRANMWGLGFRAAPLGPDWVMWMRHELDTGRGGKWAWRGVLDESHTVVKTVRTRNLSACTTFDHVKEVWWEYRLGSIADAFLELCTLPLGREYRPIVDVVVGGCGLLANAAKFDKYRLEGGYQHKQTLLGTLYQVEALLREVRDNADINGEYNPVEWKYRASEMITQCATTAGELAIWANNPNGVMTPCTKPVPLVARFGLTASAFVELAAPYAAPNCAIAVQGAVEGWSYELTQRVHADTGKALAVETWVNELGDEYMRAPQAYELAAILDEYKKLIAPMVWADYLNAVNNNGPGYLAAESREKFKGRK